MEEKKQVTKVTYSGLHVSSRNRDEGLSSGESKDDFFGKDSIFARLFAKTMSQE